MYDPETRKITGLLDYEDCIGGDPLFEIVWMRYYFEHEGRDQSYFDFDRFEVGYGAVERNDSRQSLYRPFTYLDKLRWIDPNSSRAEDYRAILETMVRSL